MKTIKFKNKFTKARYSLKKSFCIHLSNWLLESAAKLPKFQGGIVANLQKIDEHRKKDVFSVSKPDGVDLEFLHLWILETFLIGELDELRHGLQNLFGDFSKTRYIIPPKAEREDIDEVFKRIGKSLLGLSLHRIGFIDVLGNKEKVKGKRNWIENFNVSVHHFSPSFVAVSFGVEPTTAFKKIIHDVLSEDVPGRVEFKLPKSLKQLKLWFTFPSYSQLFSTHVKRELIENLMLEFKFEAIEIIKQYLKGIFIRSGFQIPSIELYLEQSSISQKAEPNQSEAEKKSQLFWDSIGMNKRDLGYFRSEQNDIGIFLPYWHSKDLIDKPFKILVDKAKVVENQKGTNDIYHKIIHEKEYYIEALTPILIIQELLQCILRENVSMIKLLLNRVSIKAAFFKRHTFKKLILLKQKTNGLYLLFKRIKLEFKADWIKIRAKNSGLPILVNNRNIVKQSNESDFLTSVIEQVKYEIELAQENLEFINTAVNELLQAETIESNYKVQRGMFWLTIVMILLAVITALPEKMREEAFSYLYKLFIK